MLLLQIEHTGNLIGLYREDRWSRRHGTHGSPDTILFSIEFTWKKRELVSTIQKWVGGESRRERSCLVLSDQFVDGVEKPTVNPDDNSHV